jgi:AraC-like DNA-binding protein
MSYDERPAPDWIAGPVSCLWSTVSTGDGTVLPDACADIIHVRGHGTFVAGPDTGPTSSGVVPTGAEVTGVRLRTGHVGPVLGVPADELQGRRVPLEELWGPAAAELHRRLDDAPDPVARQGLLAAAVARRAAEPDPLAIGAVDLLARDPGLRVSALAAELALSERHLLRRVRAAAGYGPRTLARILRFQRLLALAQTRPDSLAGLAAEAGYADQPHMTGEVRRLAGAPPTAILGVAQARGDRALLRADDAHGLGSGHVPRTAQRHLPRA